MPQGMKCNFENTNRRNLLPITTFSIRTVQGELLVGSINDAPDFLKDNEYIQHGYRVNCHCMKDVLKSLFMLHNESVNIWTHLLGALFAIVLVVYTTIFIQSHHKQLLNKIDFTQLNEDIKHLTGPILHVFPDVDDMTKKISEEYESSKSTINSIAKSIYEKTSKIIEAVDNKVGVSEYFKCKECLEIIGNAVQMLKDNFQEQVGIYKDKLVNNSYQIFENMTAINFFDDFNDKLDAIKDKVINLLEMDEPYWHKKVIVANRRVRRWPLFIMLSSAIICLSCSAVFHWFCAHSKKINEILSRLDYAGISILIAGSCYPPYFYFFYCEAVIRNLYLTVISVFAVTVFLYSFTPNFHSPPMRKLRGVMFLTLGLSSGLPILHLALFSNSIEGFEHSPRLLFWYLGGLAYVIGALIYINRIPEKFRPGKHDIWGHSHQIFHCFVILGVAFHYIGCLDAYYYRISYACPLR